jgi:hypothetical protein
MATPPRVTRAEVDAALARIHWRHAHVDDPRRSGLSEDPADVLEHLTRHSIPLPPWVIAADALDGLVLQTWLWWEDRRRERALLRRGVRAGLHHRELAGPLGIASRQGLRDRLDRLEALLAHDHPDEKLTRAARREATQRVDRQRWIAERAAIVRAVVDRLFRELARAPEFSTILTCIEDGSADREDRSSPMVEAGEWLTELRADLEEDQLSPATLGVLGLALAPLRIALHDSGLDEGHGLWRAVRDAERLRSDLNLTAPHHHRSG